MTLSPARLLLLAILLSAAAACGGPSGSTPTTYVSLGDSLAVGVGASDPVESGYTPLYRETLENTAGAEVELVQLGISGETSGSFIGDYSAGDSQLVRAVEALQENPGAEVTLSLGGNDLLAVSDGTDAEREAALARYTENLAFILQALGGASDPPPRITVLALYNPAPGRFTDEWTDRLNAEIRAIAESRGVSVAAGDRAFRGNEDDYARYSDYPWDIHPNDRGYEALARAFAEASESV